MAASTRRELPLEGSPTRYSMGLLDTSVLHHIRHLVPETPGAATLLTQAPRLPALPAVLDALLRPRPVRRLFGRRLLVTPHRCSLLIMRGDGALHSVRPVGGCEHRINMIFALMTFPAAPRPGTRSTPVFTATSLRRTVTRTTAPRGRESARAAVARTQPRTRRTKLTALAPSPTVKTGECRSRTEEIAAAG